MNINLKITLKTYNLYKIEKSYLIMFRTLEENVSIHGRTRFN